MACDHPGFACGATTGILQAEGGYNSFVLKNTATRNVYMLRYNGNGFVIYVNNLDQHDSAVLTFESQFGTR